MAMTMEREKILEALSLAERHIGEGECQLRLQRQVIAELRRGGHDAADAEVLLRSSEQTQKLHFADRSRLLRELAASAGQ